MVPLRISRLSLQLFFSDLLLTLLGLYLATYEVLCPSGLAGHSSLRRSLRYPSQRIS